MIFALPFVMMLALAAGQAQVPATPTVPPPRLGSTATTDTSWYLPGREEDARVAQIAFRLATAGRARCTRTVPALGLVLQHLSQFHPADRPGMITAMGLDRGPGAIVVVPGSPAEHAGIHAGDVLLAIDRTGLPPEDRRDAPFDAAQAHARADAVEDRLDQAAARPFSVTLLRDHALLTRTVAAVPACPSRVVLARSGQRNAYADGQHVFLTTGLLARVRSDDEMAFIIAHEMAHVILGHAAVMRGGTVKRGLGRTLGKSGRIVRTTEREADTLGGEMMIDAGLDPVAGIAVLKRMDTDLGIALFASHDPASRRIAAMRALAEARVQR